ncbi:MAG TPA: DUF881 domain-containing protein [Clostridia bacterium]|nr:DUF881 domain-containing protein [Clostridia bacterium]
MKTKLVHFIIIITLIILLFDFGDFFEENQYIPSKEQIIELRDKKLRLEEELDNLKEQVVLYELAIDNEDDLYELLEEEKQRYKTLAGYIPLQGEGLVILMSDSQRVRGEYQDINELIIHDQDVYQIIWELRNAGAEAISINDERFLFHYSKVVCNGPTIRVNGRLYSQPFIIKAIGPRKALQAAVNVYGSYADGLRQKGVFIEANTSVMVEIPAYEEDRPLYYLERNEQ